MVQAHQNYKIFKAYHISIQCFHNLQIPTVFEYVRKVIFIIQYDFVRFEIVHLVIFLNFKSRF